MELLFTSLAMGLDALPREGRVMLMAFLLTLTLYGLGRLLPDDASARINVLYGKSAFVAMVAVPLVFYVLGLRLPVPVEEVVRLETNWPTYVSLVLLGIWLLGAVFCVMRLTRQVAATLDAARLPVAGEMLQARADHWRLRLGMARGGRIHVGGAEPPWHVPNVVILPAAAANWPAGVTDVLLLLQLAQLKQNSWRWLVFARFLGAVFWPAPWVARMASQLAEALVPASVSLAAAAYRDSVGWSRDLRALQRRRTTLAPRFARGLLLLPEPPLSQPAPVPDRITPTVDAGSFDDRWVHTKQRVAAKRYDPYERAYWLVAGSSIVVAIATTLTLVPAQPEFEPQFLDLKWRDGMQRRLRDAYAADRLAERSPQSVSRTLSK